MSYCVEKKGVFRQGTPFFIVNIPLAYSAQDPLMILSDCKNWFLHKVTRFNEINQL